jgi:hypothetical protein
MTTSTPAESPVSFASSKKIMRQRVQGLVTDTPYEANMPQGTLIYNAA